MTRTALQRFLIGGSEVVAMNSRLPALILLGSVASALSGCHGQGPVVPSAEGTLTVSVGYGPAGNYMCEGKGTVSIEPISLSGTAGMDHSDQMGYAFSGFAKGESPACIAGVNFQKLRTAPGELPSMANESWIQPSGATRSPRCDAELRTPAAAAEH